MSQANRGAGLEELISIANATYSARHMAVVNKRPTPIRIMKNGAMGNRITNAVFDAKSTVDYEGVYRGHSLQFEAKQTIIETVFPLKNTHEHQVEHMRACMAQGAICFMVVEFTKRREIFYVPAKMVVEAWDFAQRGGRKSIPYEDIGRLCYLLTSGRGVVLDYLAVVDRLLDQAVAL